MQQREKLLAAALAAVIVLWLGLPLFESVFVAPLTELDGRETYLQDEVERLRAERLNLARAEALIGKWTVQSLPREPLNAQRVYLEWLTDLAQLSGFRDAKVTSPWSPRKERSFQLVSVKIEGAATFQQLQYFVDRFREVNLLHRIASCKSVSGDTSGNPLLTVEILAEGLALEEAPSRNRLFPQTELVEPIAADATQLTVHAVDEFPKKPPFRIRLDDEYLEVTAVDGARWTVRRGLVDTVPLEHPMDVPVELVPLKSDLPKSAKLLAATAFFAKPSPPVVYEPKLAQLPPPPVIRGTTWTWKPEVVGWNPLDPDPTFQLDGGPEGVSFDPRTGEMSWTPDESVEDGTYPGELTVLAAGKERLKATLPFRLRPPNNPPKIEPVDRLTFYFGRESSARIKVTDADLPNQQLTFTLEGAPAGMAIDPQTGVIRWNPPFELEQESTSVTVKVTDSDELPLSDSVTIPITLGEDAAKYTRLTGLMRDGSGEKQVLLTDISSGKNYRLNVGSEVQIADISFKLLNIDVQNAQILVERDGKQFTLQRGEPVVGLKPVPSPETGDPPAEPARPIQPVSIEGTPGEALSSQGPAPSSTGDLPAPKKLGSAEPADETAGDPDPDAGR